MDGKSILTDALDQLAGLAYAWNDAREDEDRGRGNDLLCLVIAEDGSGMIGALHGYAEHERTSFVDLSVNKQHEFENVEELSSYLLDWGLRPSEQRTQQDAEIQQLRSALAELILDTIHPGSHPWPAWDGARRLLKDDKRLANILGPVEEGDG